jgi:hypothetical protein
MEIETMTASSTATVAALIYNGSGSPVGPGVGAGQGLAETLLTHIIRLSGPPLHVAVSNYRR